MNLADPPSGWKSDATCQAESGSWPPGIQASTSWVANVNAYQAVYPNNVPWDMYTNGTALGGWKTPYVNSAPNNVTQVPGYPIYTSYDQFGSGYSSQHGWEWSMVYEWSVDLGPDGANCGDQPIWLVTGVSHHSPAKNGTENDPFPPSSPDDPPILSDWGDLPDSYQTIKANDGARHYLTVSGPYLGQTIEFEPDGKPTANATGDGSEEDGVSIDLTDRTIDAYVTNGPALLAGWFDWNDNGSFEQSEFNYWNVTSGLNTLPFTIGSGFDLPTSTRLYARFRIFSDAEAAPGGSLDWQDYRGAAKNGEVEDYLFTPAVSIGNRIWLDENSDGYQDAGEPGIANVQVNLYGADGSEIATTYTDANGGYLFSGLWSGSYFVDVLDGAGNQSYSLPFPGMTQTPPSLLAGADFGNQDHSTAIPNTNFTGYPLTINQGQENLTADFGYNYRPAGNVNGGVGTGAIGDRVWIDADGDGFQDTGETGLEGVTVTLFHDPDKDGVYEDVLATTITDALGYYIFNDLPAGAYLIEAAAPAGYTQTGDPDLPGLQCGAGCDARTTVPIILAPGDVYLNADFGYQPPPSQNNIIGDRVWFDANANGVQNAGEPGIAGVTVALIKDTNNDGIWNAGEPLIATTLSGADGVYLFSGLPDGSYLVWVNDTDNVLGEKGSVFDDNGGSAPIGKGAPTGQASSSVLGLSAVTDLGLGNPNPVSNLDQDFGYTAPGHTTGLGLIGDRIWLDIDGNGIQDAAEPGLEGVYVELRDSNNIVLGLTHTDENGYYAFGGLPAGSYTLVVTPPAGMDQTYDADGTGSPHRSTITLTTGGIDLAQDFGYRGVGSIGNLVWEDRNADGGVDEGEPGISGVTLDLYWDQNRNGKIDSGEPLVGSTVTGVNGSYSFQGLPVDDGGGSAHFVVVVADKTRLLHGYWHSLGSPGVDNHSQVDPYAVTLTPGLHHNPTGDFGYYRQPAKVGDLVWLDRNNDGIQDADEPGLKDIPVTLTINYPDGSVSTVVTTTSRGGIYTFGNLLLDEDHNLADHTEGTPTYTISFGAPPGTTPSLVGQGDDPALDSNGVITVVNLLYQGQTDITYDSGFHTDLHDLGDLPEGLAGTPNYSTRFVNGPAHLVFPAGSGNKPLTTDGVPAVWLGQTVDTELDGQPSADALGDGADEDGLVFDTPNWIAGGSTEARITLNSSEPGVEVYFALWIDWNGNGSFSDATDGFYTGSGVTSSPVEATVTVSIPADYNTEDKVYMRLRAYTAPLEFDDYQGALVNGEVEDYLWDNGLITPITLSYFSSSRSGSTVTFEWSTDTESGNLGFNLYADAPTGRQILNSSLIPSSVFDSIERTDYSYSHQLPQGRVIYIEDISVLGETRLHGPFLLGETYGMRHIAQVIDWAAIQQEHDRKEAQRFGGWKQSVYPEVELLVRQDGLYRVTYEQLLAEGLDLNRVPSNQIAVLNRGQAVPVYVSSNGLFGPGQYIEFYGEALDTLYTDTNVYTIRLDHKLALQVKTANGKPVNRGVPAPYYMETVRTNYQKYYYNGAFGDDPWYEQHLFVGATPQSIDIALVVDDYLPGQAPTQLALRGFGATIYDHHVLFRLNDVLIADHYFSDITAFDIDVELPPGLLQPGKNSLRITAPADTGAPNDLIMYDGYTLTYPRAFSAREGRLTFTASGAKFQVTGLPSKEVVVYRLDEQGWTRLTNVEIGADGEVYSARFNGSSQPATYIVSTGCALLTPALQFARPYEDISSGKAEYLIISHPDFIDGLQPLVAARQAQGLTVKVVDVEAIYAQYGYGIFDPYGIKEYIHIAARNMDVKYVLLVGGDTYDYRNYMGLNPVSFIPSLYAPVTRTARFVTVDPLYVDLDGDLAPDLPIGRFPVRTSAELTALVNKTLAYQNKTYSGTAVFVADKHDDQVSFAGVSDSMLAQLPPGWNATRLHLDTLAASTARVELINRINAGVALVNYTGHSSLQNWSSSSFLAVTHVNNLANVGRPTVVVQWGCYNTYYATSSSNILSYSFLQRGAQGAAAILGGTHLVLASSEAALGPILTRYIAQPGMSLGQAVQLAKAELELTQPGLVDVQLGWTLLGDPALIVQP